MFILYQDDTKIGEFENVARCAESFGVTRSYLCQRKRFESVYQWKNYLLYKAGSWEAEAYILWLRTKKYIDNPATSWMMYQELKKSIEKVNAKLL